MRIVLHFKTKQLLNQRKRQLLADSPRLNGVNNIEVSQLITSAAAVSNQEEGHQHQQPPRVHTTIETIDKLEEEATRTLIYCLTSLLLLYSPILVYIIVLLVQSLFYPIKDLFSLLQWIKYVKELAAFHGVLQPITHLLWSQDVKTSWFVFKNNRFCCP